MAIQAAYDDEKKHVHVISYGGGTQSTALLLMALKGEINGIIPDHIIFADTGWEGKATYEWINKVNNHIIERFGRAITITQKGNIYEDALRSRKDGSRFASMPLFVEDHGKKRMIRRQCTGEYKVFPVQKKIRELLGYKPKQRVKEMVHMWKGISTDEITRVKPSAERWITAEHPLVDYMDMSRTDCIKYVEAEGLGTPPKSACIGCPFRDDKSWLDMQRNNPEEFQEAVTLDEAIRDSLRYGAAFLHAKRLPLTEVVFNGKRNDNITPPPDHFFEDDYLDFTNECEGMCGL